MIGVPPMKSPILDVAIKTFIDLKKGQLHNKFSKFEKPPLKTTQICYFCHRTDQPGNPVWECCEPLFTSLVASSVVGAYTWLLSCCDVCRNIPMQRLQSDQVLFLFTLDCRRRLSGGPIEDICSQPDVIYMRCFCYSNQPSFLPWFFFLLKSKLS